jgi:hypothetical protein
MMCTPTCGQFEIEDLRNHPLGMVEDLREQMSECAKMTPDPKRAGFYEVEAAHVTYYVSIVPGSGKVLLLAAWPTGKTVPPNR